MRMIATLFFLTALLPMAVNVSAMNNNTKMGSAYCYYNQKNLVWRLGNDAIEAVIHFDASSGGLKVESLRAKHGVELMSNANPGLMTFMISGKDNPVTLRSGWQFTWQSVSDLSLGGRLLTIHMDGVGKNDGIEIEEYFEIMPGMNSRLVNRATLINHTDGALKLEQLRFAAMALSASSVHASLFVSNPGDKVILNQNNAVACQEKPDAEVKKDGRFFTQKAVIFVGQKKGSGAYMTMQESSATLQP